MKKKVIFRKSQVIQQGKKITEVSQTEKFSLPSALPEEVSLRFSSPNIKKVMGWQLDLMTFSNLHNSMTL